MFEGLFEGSFQCMFEGLFQCLFEGSFQCMFEGLKADNEFTVPWCRSSWSLKFLSNIQRLHQKDQASSTGTVSNQVWKSLISLRAWSEPWSYINDSLHIYWYWSTRISDLYSCIRCPRGRNLVYKCRRSCQLCYDNDHLYRDLETKCTHRCLKQIKVRLKILRKVTSSH